MIILPEYPVGSVGSAISYHTVELRLFGKDGAVVVKEDALM